MKILEQRALRGPNRYSRRPCIYLQLNIEELENKPSDKLEGFTEKLTELLPSLYEHRCSVGEPGGFIQRLHRGTWAGHIVEHIAIELQCLAGMEVGFGKTYDTPQEGIYDIVYRYRVESAGLFAGRKAVEIVDSLVTKGSFHGLDAVIDELKRIREEDMLGPSTASIVEEASARGIPSIRLNGGSYVQLGYGAKQRRIQATMTDRTSALGVEIADEKYRTKELLRQAGIPVPEGAIVSTLEEATELAQELGFPVAVKPEVGNHGKGITANVQSMQDLEIAFQSAKQRCSSVIIEKSLSGHDYRALVIDCKLVAASLREPAFVVGDGKSSISELITEVNSDARRGVGHEKVLTRIDVDEMTTRLLAQQDYSLDAILQEGKRLYLKSTANLSTGGTATDVTDDVHPDVRLMCQRIARIVGLDCIGIDIVAPCLSIPLDDSSGVVEVNAAPGFRMHLDPTEGKPRNVAKPFVEMLFPVNTDFEVPIVAVTGTNGKTTTTRLIAHAIKYAGGVVGLAGTIGIEVDGARIDSGDYSGPDGARAVLRDPTIDHAVVEVARGGIIRRGLGFPECSVAVLLNIQEDHIGTDNVFSLEDLSLVKSAVLEVAKETGASVLNADDEIVAGLSPRARGRIIYFSMRSDNQIVLDHVESGGTAVVLDGSFIVIRSQEPDVRVSNVKDVPITFRGAVKFNISNVLAAVAALHGLGMNIKKIRNGIETFHPSITQNPGRMNLIDFPTFKVVMDYAHNAPSVRALGAVLPQICAGKKIVVAHGTGSRIDSEIKLFGRTLAEVYDHVIVTDIDRRGRRSGETADLVCQGAIERGMSKSRVEYYLDPMEAIDRAFELVDSGDLIIVQVDELEPMHDRVMEHFERIVASTEGKSVDMRIETDPIGQTRR